MSTRTHYARVSHAQRANPIFHTLYLSTGHRYLPRKGPVAFALVFALNEELKCMTHSPSFTLEAVSQLDHGALAALASIREWKNSSNRVNRIPTDILSLIPTHLPAQKDRFHATSVCRHWHGTLLKHGVLWSQLFLMSDIIAHGDDPAGTIPMISPRAHQIRYLEFMEYSWQDIAEFSESNSGQLPLLHTIKILCSEGSHPHGQSAVASPSSSPYFRGSINLEQFVLDFAKLSSLCHFVFPNLTMLQTVEREVYVTGTRETSVTHLRICPTSFSWNTIIQQYMASPIEAVTLSINYPWEKGIQGFLVIQSRTAVVRLGFKVEKICWDDAGLSMSHAEMCCQIFPQALTTIQDHPLLSHFKRLELRHWAVLESLWVELMANKVEELLTVLGPLDKLTIWGCDLRVLLSTFLGNPELEDLE
ncbi:hypothetical protein BJ322DRAFT_1115160 [Thelephora terrestris]|uniref:F-box domain-containing protein n=1 Tax=Thelephora terrestris TaxID=56493 RepID=A0A9P6H186_9AGAM|nr:hypothetical protein BJ322DRAFT_1115160 [Thelephora terrestris]